MSSILVVLADGLNTVFSLWVQLLLKLSAKIVFFKQLFVYLQIINDIRDR